MMNRRRFLYPVVIAILLLGLFFYYLVQKNYQSEALLWQGVLHSNDQTLWITRSISDTLSGNPQLEALARTYVKQMSDEELAGIVLMPAITVDTSLEELHTWIVDNHVGGFMVLVSDYPKEKIDELNRLASEVTDLPLLLAIDAEPSLLSYRLPSIDALVPNTNEILTVAASYEAGVTIGEHLRTLGYHINFAPVYDGNENQEVIGNRSYGPVGEMSQALADSFVEGSIETGVVPVAKHFPGHGSVLGDTHQNLQTVSGDLPELANFVSAIDAGVPAIMLGHLAVSGGTWDTSGVPASLSPTVATKLLRDELGFDGLIITDALNMGALSTIDHIAPRALYAGADILLYPRDVSEAYEELVHELEHHPELRSEFEERAQCIIRFKIILRLIKK